MKQLSIFFTLTIMSISGFAQYTYIGHNGADCSSTMNISYTYTEYSLGSHGNGYTIYRDGVPVLNKFDEWGGYFVKSLDFLNDSVGFVTDNWQGILSVLRTVDYGTTWERIGGENMYFTDIYFVNMHTGYLIGKTGSQYSDNVKITRIILDNNRIVYWTNVNNTTTQYNALDTIMGDPLCQGQQNLVFQVQKSGVDIYFDIFYNYIISGVNNLSKSNSITIFPNPARDIIFLDVDNNSMLKVNIYDYSGKLLKNGRTIDKSIDISDLKTGMYLLVIEAKDEIYHTKLLVE